MHSRDLCCPSCGEPRHTRLDQTTVTVSLDGKVEHSTYPVGYVVFACSCPVRIQPLAALVKSVGKTLHAEIEAALAAQREREAVANTAREAEAQRARLAQAEASIRAWATGAVADRVVHRGAGYVVYQPMLPDGVALDDLAEAVRILYRTAVVEAEVEARQRDLADAEKLAAAKAQEPRMWAEQARREVEERRKRREAMTDVEPPDPT